MHTKKILRVLSTAKKASKNTLKKPGDTLRTQTSTHASQIRLAEGRNETRTRISIFPTQTCACRIHGS
jgi:hypothetical protein